MERLGERNAEAVELSVAMFHEVSKTDLRKWIEELKIQLDTARKKADVAGSDLMAELENCKDEKSILELKLAQYRLDQLQKSMTAKLSDSGVSETLEPKMSGIDAINAMEQDVELEMAQAKETT